MLKFNSQEGSIELNGSVGMIACETLAMMRGIYRTFQNNISQEAADYYKRTISELFKSAFMSDEELQQEMNKDKENILKRLESLKDLLDNLSDKVAKDMNENKDIRSADFDSNEDFEKWFHGFGGEDSSDD